MKNNFLPHMRALNNKKITFELLLAQISCLTIDGTSISKSVSSISESITTISSISKTRISISESSISKTSTIAIGSIQKTSISFSLWLSLSLTLGNMDNTSRVGNIPASSSISSSKGRESSRSNSCNSYSVGNIGDSVSGSNWGSKSISVAKPSIAKSSTIAKPSISQPSSVSITSVKESSIGISLSSSKSSTANHKSNLDHLHPEVKQRIPM